jgi:hypothetical protein
MNANARHGLLKLKKPLLIERLFFGIAPEYLNDIETQVSSKIIKSRSAAPFAKLIAS